MFNPWTASSSPAIPNNAARDVARTNDGSNTGEKIPSCAFGVAAGQEGAAPGHGSASLTRRILISSSATNKSCTPTSSHSVGLRLLTTENRNQSGSEPGAVKANNPIQTWKNKIVPQNDFRVRRACQIIWAARKLKIIHSKSAPSSRSLMHATASTVLPTSITLRVRSVKSDLLEGADLE